MAKWIAEYKYKKLDEITKIINNIYSFECSACGWRTGQQGISFQFCPHCGEPMENASCLDVIPKESVDEILAEIPNLAHWQSKDGQDLVMAYDVMKLIKEKTNG